MFASAICLMTNRSGQKGIGDLLSIPARPFKLFCFFTLVVVLFGPAARKAEAQHGQMSFGGGVLSWSVTSSSKVCANTADYYQYTFSNFEFAYAGTTYPLGGDDYWNGTIYTGTPANCRVPTPPVPTNFSLSTFGSSCFLFFTPASSNGGSLVMTDTPITNASQATNTGCIFPPGGYINPKWVVIDVIYAPPGSKSYVSYSNSTTVSDTQSVVSTSSTSVKTSVSITESGKLFSFLSGSQTDSYSNTLTQQNQDTQSVTLSDTNTSALTVYGPGSSDECDAVASDYVGVDHNCDTIRVWLNPVMLFTVTDGVVTWNGYGSSGLDPVAPIHIDDVKVGCLNGALAQTSSVCSPFFSDATRTWAANENWPSGQGPGLTTADLANILAADRWGNCTPTSAIGSSVCPTYVTPGFSLLPPDFYLSDQENMPYQQGGPQSTYTVSSTQSNMQGESSTSTEAQTYGVEDAFTGSTFLAGFKASVGVSQTLTTSNEVNNQTTQSSTFIGTANITGPACSGDPCSPAYPPTPAYYGEATQFDVFTDQFYGTFVFLPSDY
jgi:hypothetical protein